MQNILTPAAEQVLAEGRAIAQSASRNPIAQRYLSSNYAQSHFNAASYSNRVGVPCAVVRDDERFLGVRCFRLVELSAALALNYQIVAVYEDGVRCEEEPVAAQEPEVSPAEYAEGMALLWEMIAEEERDLALAYEMLAERLNAGSSAPVSAPVHVIRFERRERRAYCETPYADRARYRQAQCELFGACREAGLPTTGDGREAMIAALRVFFQDARITSRTQLSPSEMDAARLAIQSGRLRWSVEGVESIAQAA